MSGIRTPGSWILPSLWHPVKMKRESRKKIQCFMEEEFIIQIYVMEEAKSIFLKNN
jgi:hypothetical protein